MLSVENKWKAIVSETWNLPPEMAFAASKTMVRSEKENLALKPNLLLLEGKEVSTQWSPVSLQRLEYKATSLACRYVPF